MRKVLILLTNQATMGDTDEPNGTYAPELTHALHAFQQADLGYDFVSILGGAAPLYGEDTDDQINLAVLAQDDVISQLNNTMRVSDVSVDDYDAVFYPGGFGLLWDLAKDESAGKLTAAIYAKGGIVGAVCHGPAGLLPVTLANGTSILANMEVTSFTREEEVDFGTIDKIPFLVEESLTRAARRFSKIAPWGVNVIEQDRLITGQNPASAAGVGQAMVRRIAALDV